MDPRFNSLFALENSPQEANTKPAADSGRATMHPQFDELFTDPWNQVFQVIFYPDRVYHAAYLNATRSNRYRYNVREVRNAFDITVVKSEVYLDGVFLSNVLRIEYRAGRLTEVAREKNRLLQDQIGMYIKLINPDQATPDGEEGPFENNVTLHYDKWINAYQTEIWETVSPPPGKRHDFRILDQIGLSGSITSVYAFKMLIARLFDIRKVELAFHEPAIESITRNRIFDPVWDNNYLRSYQSPVRNAPSSPENTIAKLNYLVDFRRGYFFSNLRDLEPVKYRNAMMDDINEDRDDDNVIEMRWIVQREFASSVVFFHEVTIPPGKVEGTHRHIGTEELYCITEGEGIVYMGDGDDPDLKDYPVVDRDIYGFDRRACRELKVQKGSVVYTKSGGIHGICNNGTEPLRFVAFLYHTA
ncbi:cupin domain-containing protein [Klebsiella pneumoniae]